MINNTLILNPHTGELRKTNAIKKNVVGCYDEETMVLTNHGWKYFRELNKTEKILSLNADYKIAEYCPLKSVYKKKYEGKMITCDTKTCNFKMTPNNKILCGFRTKNQNKFSRWQIKNINDIKNSNNIFLKKGFIWKRKENKYYILKGYIRNRLTEYKILMDLWLKFLGWYISEGSLLNIVL